MLNKYSCYLSESVFRLAVSFRVHLACFFRPTMNYCCHVIVVKASHDLGGLAGRPEEVCEMPESLPPSEIQTPNGNTNIY